MIFGGAVIIGTDNFFNFDNGTNQGICNLFHIYTIQGVHL